jgi:type IV fimbrial biogenesis protein FimT
MTWIHTSRGRAARCEFLESVLRFYTTAHMKKSSRFLDRPRWQLGVTLVEICIVLAVAIILAATAAPGMLDLIDTRRLEGAASQLATDIQLARTEAVARNEPLRLSMHPTASGSCYVIHTGAADQCACDSEGAARCTGEARQIKTVSVASRDHVSLEANVSSMVFDPLHGTATPSATLRLIGSRGREIRHVVNVMGRARSCSPLSAMPGYRPC